MSKNYYITDFEEDAIVPVLCIECGVWFGMTRSMIESRHKIGKPSCCPNGHENNPFMAGDAKEEEDDDRVKGLKMENVKLHQRIEQMEGRVIEAEEKAKAQRGAV